MLTFDNDEAGYLRWVTENPTGFVINTPKQPGAFPDMLHRASCWFITTDKWTNYTTTDCMKICSLDRQVLIAWGNSHSSDFRKCKHCKP
jgi:hypothetical protein